MTIHSSTRSLRCLRCVRSENHKGIPSQVLTAVAATNKLDQSGQDVDTNPAVLREGFRHHDTSYEDARTYKLPWEMYTGLNNSDEVEPSKPSSFL